MAVLADVIDAAAVNAMADAALKKFGRIDYLINNVAQRGEKAIEDMTFEESRKVIGVTLDGAFHCVKACLARIKKSDAGSIIKVGRLHRRDGRARPPARGHRQGRHRRLHPRLGDGICPPQGHRQHAGPGDAGAARQAARNTGASALPAAAWPRRLADRLRAAGALPGWARRPLHDRPDSSTSTAGVFLARPLVADLDHRHHRHRRVADHVGLSRPADADRGARVHPGVRLGRAFGRLSLRANVIGALFILTAGIGTIKRMGGVLALQLGLVIGARSLLLYLVPSSRSHSSPA